VSRLARPSPGRRLGIDPEVGADPLDHLSHQDGGDDLELRGAAVGALSVYWPAGWRRGTCTPGWASLQHRTSGCGAPIARTLLRSMVHEDIEIVTNLTNVSLQVGQNRYTKGGVRSLACWRRGKL
jgi:hypothetical protein